MSKFVTDTKKELETKFLDGCFDTAVVLKSKSVKFPKYEYPIQVYLIMETKYTFRGDATPYFRIQTWGEQSVDQLAGSLFQACEMFDEYGT
jgi:hypothetical protein